MTDLSARLQAAGVNDRPLLLAEFIHAQYEELAPVFGYVTRADTRVLDPATPNGMLMIAVSLRILAALDATDTQEKP